MFTLSPKVGSKSCKHKHIAYRPKFLNVLKSFFNQDFWVLRFSDRYLTKFEKLLSNINTPGFKAYKMAEISLRLYLSSLFNNDKVKSSIVQQIYLKK